MTICGSFYSIALLLLYPGAILLAIGYSPADKKMNCSGNVDANVVDEYGTSLTSGNGRLLAPF